MEKKNKCLVCNPAVIGRAQYNSVLVIFSMLGVGANGGVEGVGCWWLEGLHFHPLPIVSKLAAPCHASTSSGACNIKINTSRIT